MKKILYVTTVSRTINAFLIPHIKMLIDKGNIVDVACNIDKPINEELINKGVKVYEIPYQRNPFRIKNLKALELLKEIQQNEQYDIIHVHTPVAAFYTRILKLKFPNVKMVYTAHGFHFCKGAPIINWLLYYPAEIIAARWTDALITINEEDYNNGVKLGIKGGQVHKINGVGVEGIRIEHSNTYVRKELGIKKDDLVLTVVAELNKNKNHIQVIKAMRVLKEENKDIKVLFVGEGKLRRYLERKINKYGLESNIMLLGFRNDVISIIKESDVVGLFSKREGLPRSIMEAMMCGKPIIATDNRGCRELVEDNVNGYIVDISDIKETVNKIRLLYKDKEKITKMGNQSKIKFERYRIKKILKNLEIIYSKVLKNEIINNHI
ncbi:glycosyltransferase family 4 protein [Oceanirhabdus sp. W0125-5]|uniref:glycosyltransferase family 4 protein n=1 Tax=Oceanirhabdus sp. W0125-5 TaxID=2999116 RepID=UPI0022F3265D|nr:glycosyltransferase family 4 protein [Oceanirhabdus sp. W0125-5]WBW98947.1 glycosyltransferase family 4 protein [Oceanirhabdus sp. W0125-5]